MTTIEKIQIAQVLAPALYAVANSPDLPPELKQPALDKANALYNFLVAEADIVLA